MSRLSDLPPIWRLGAAMPPAGPHIAVVPGADAPLLQVELPASLRGQARERVAGRQLAEALAVPLNQLELHAFSTGKTAWGRMLVTDADAAADWRKAVRPGCIALLPDYLALLCIKDVWTIDTHEGVAARLGPSDGFAAEPDLAVRLLSETEPPRAILRQGPAEPLLDDYLTSLAVPIFDNLATLVASGTEKPLRWSQASGAINLAAPPSAAYERLGQTLSQWRWPVIFGALALGAFLGSLVLETRRFEAEAAVAQTMTQDLVRQHFVPEGPILNVRAQVQAVVDAAETPQTQSTTIPPLILLQQAAPTLDQDALRLQVAEYRTDIGLVAGLTATDFASLDALVDDLRNGGFLVEVLDSRAQASGGVAARLRLQAEPQG